MVEVFVFDGLPAVLVTTIDTVGASVAERLSLSSPDTLPTPPRPDDLPTTSLSSMRRCCQDTSSNFHSSLHKKSSPPRARDREIYFKALEKEWWSQSEEAPPPPLPPPPTGHFTGNCCRFRGNRSPRSSNHRCLCCSMMKRLQLLLLL